MRKILFAFAITVVHINAQGQTDTIKIFADLTSLNYETAALKTNDTATINEWIKNLATKDVQHVDSILHHTVILDFNTDAFNMPLVLQSEQAELKITPTIKWQRISITDAQKKLFDKDSIEKMYYITAKETKGS
jgi:hypothetical protein